MHNLLTISHVQQIAAMAQTFGMGYQAADLNGDGCVDGLDLVLADNNAARGVQELVP